MESRKLTKDEFLQKWEADKQAKERAIQRMHRYLTMRHNDDRIRRVVKRRRTK